MSGWTVRLRGQLAYLLVLAVLVASLVYLLVEPHHWRRGVALLAGSILLAGVLRLALPDTLAGMLAVRRRWLDVAIYLGLGVLILVADIRLRT